MQPAIDNVRPPGGGRIGLVACPGRGAGSAGTAALDLDLAAIADWGASTLVTLVEAFELTLLGVEGMGERAQAQGLIWWHLPLLDGAAPGPRFESAWATAGPALHAQLDADARIVLHCHAGLGRTGSIAARLLIERGLSPQAAVIAVRRARPGAIENDEQLRWVLACPGGGATR